VSEVAAKAQKAKEAVEVVFEEKCAAIDKRSDQLERISTPTSDATEASTQKAVDDASEYLKSLGLKV
tara:strand:+ start:334 stop:534 length:201 start_codon:yes stop_codon:yes gene_type:complete